MELFAHDEAVAQLAATLALVEGVARLPLLVELAWQLRERDFKQAQQLVEEAQTLLGLFSASDESRRLHARLLLTRGALLTLQSELDMAEQQIDAALAILEPTSDTLASGDAHYCLATLWQDRGQVKQRDHHLTLALADFQSVGDAVRADLCRARLLHYAAFRDVPGTRAQLAAQFDPHQNYPACVNAWLESARAVVASFSGDPASAIRDFLKAWAAARSTGQIRQAATAASNASDAFSTLGDLNAALEWDEQALELARSNGLPGMMGSTLMQTANVLRMLGRHPDAQQALAEAQTALSGMRSSSTYAISLQYQGELALDMGQPQLALEVLNQLEQRINFGDSPQMMLRCWRAQAEALCRLAEPQAAMQKVALALAQARAESSTDEQIKLLRIQAELHRLHPLPAPPELSAPNAELHYLNAALAVAKTIEGYALPADLLEQMANAYAACGDYPTAFRHAQALAAARDNKRLQEANNRAIAMQVRHDTERARFDAEHHRQLAETESRRAALLQEARNTLETLGLIGREITASLNAEAVFSALYRHVNQLLDASSFCIYLLAADGLQLHGVFGIELGQLIELGQIALDDPFSFSARCAREQEEVFVDSGPEVHDGEVIPGTLNTLSLLFTPLMVGERLLGVMSIQSIREHAYGERERSIFRTLCAYGAIGLDNAAAYSLAETARQQADNARQQADQALTELRLAQARLVQSEKMASLGRLVAGIAHELNTPLGNGLVAVTTLRDQLHTFRQQANEHGIKRHMFDTFLANVEQASGIVFNSLERSARLVHSFKQLAVEQSSVRKQRFALFEVINRVLADFEPRLQGTPYRIHAAIPVELQLNSFPDALTEVLARLLDNALVHGFENRAQGQIHIRCKLGGMAGLRILVQDDGNGIAKADQAKVFDPFFTTHFGQGSSGLGLHIAHNTVVRILGGTLAVFSQPGEGCEFEIDLPLVAPNQESR
jgi:signal transduction histidine kinase